MEKFRRFVVTKLDNYFIPLGAFYLIFEFLLFYLLHLFFLKSVFFPKNYFYFSIFSDVNNREYHASHVVGGWVFCSHTGSVDLFYL